MKTQNIIMTSVLAIIIASPAMATPAAGQLVTDGAMCTLNDLGVSEGTANATAQFSVNSYNCAAGTYLPAGDTWTVAEIAANDGRRTCPAGSYCSGSGDEENGVFIYSDDEDQGIGSCDEDYSGSTSDAGATSSEMCYYTASCPTISAATACDAHAATCAYTTPANTTNKKYYIETGEFTGSCAMTFTCGTGYSKSTTQSAPTLPSTSTDGNAYRSHSLDNTRYCSNTGCTNSSGLSGANLEAYNSLSTGEWAVDWTSGTAGTMKGIASCNAVPGDNSNAWANASTLPANTDLASTSTTGRYCWCKPTSWTPSGGSEQLLSAAWVFYYDLEDASDCARNCARDCARNVRSTADVRSALFGVVGASMQCVANTIDINWKNENGTVFTTDQCTYDESLTVPSTHPDKRGYTFTGWKFVNPSQN